MHSDVWGLSSTTSVNRYKYYVVFIDAFSKYVWFYPMKNKSEVLQKFIDFKTMAELQLNHKIKNLQSDCGGEYKALSQFLNTHGILHRISCPHTPQQNGVSERRHRQVTEIGLALLAHASLPLKYWVDSFLPAVYLINRLPTPLLDHKSPLEVLFHTKPNYSTLKVFGCACFPDLRPYNSHKFHFKSVKCTFLGYSPCYKGYKCLDSNNRLYISHNVLFDEQSFPFKSTLPSTDNSSAKYSATSIFSPLDIPLVPSQSSRTADILPFLHNNSTIDLLPENCGAVDRSQVLGDCSSSSESVSSSNSDYGATSSGMSQPAQTQAQPVAALRPSQSTHSMITRSRSGILKPKNFYCYC